MAVTSYKLTAKSNNYYTGGNDVKAHECANIIQVTFDVTVKAPNNSVHVEVFTGIKSNTFASLVMVVPYGEAIGSSTKALNAKLQYKSIYCAFGVANSIYQSTLIALK